MVGSGTTALMAVADGRRVVAADIDPLSCLITRAKCTPIDASELRETFSDLVDAVGPLGYRASVTVSPEDAIAELEESTPYRSPPHVYHWFHPTVARDLARVLLELGRLTRSAPPAKRDALEAVVAGAIRRVSRADPAPVSGLEVTRPRRQELSQGLRFDLRRELLERADVLALGYEELASLDSLGEVRVSTWDAREWSKIVQEAPPPPALQITSPPYLRAIDYWRRHKLENYWLGLLKAPNQAYVPYGRNFIGARPLLQRDNERATDVLPPPLRHLCSRLALRSRPLGRLARHYFLDLADWLGEVAEVTVRSGGDAYLVLGPSSVAGVRVRTPYWTTMLAKDEGLRLVSSVRHKVVNHRMQFTLRHGTRVTQESVLHFRSSR